MTSAAGLLPPPAPLLDFPAACTTVSVAELLDSIEKLRMCQATGSPPVNASRVSHPFVDIVPIKDTDVEMQTLWDDQCALLVPTTARIVQS